jgi:hypothetical protein
MALSSVSDLIPSASVTTAAPLAGLWLQALSARTVLSPVQTGSAATFTVLTSTRRVSTGRSSQYRYETCMRTRRFHFAFLFAFSPLKKGTAQGRYTCTCIGAILKCAFTPLAIDYNRQRMNNKMKLSLTDHDFLFLTPTHRSVPTSSVTCNTTSQEIEGFHGNDSRPLSNPLSIT